MFLNISSVSAGGVEIIWNPRWGSVVPVAGMIT